MTGFGKTSEGLLVAPEAPIQSARASVGSRPSCSASSRHHNASSSRRVPARTCRSAIAVQVLATISSDTARQHDQYFSYAALQPMPTDTYLQVDVQKPARLVANALLKP